MTAAATVTPNAEPHGFVHSALMYRTEEEYLDGLLPFVLDGLDRDEPVLAAVPTGNLALLRDALGDAAAGVTLVDMADVGRNPGRVLAVEGAFAAKHGDRRSRIVGEVVWPTRGADEYPACVQHEALANKAFEGRAVTALCPYDAGRLDEQVLADARTTHPLVDQRGATDRSAEYAPDDALSRYNHALVCDAGAAVYTVTGFAGLSKARSFAARYARWHGLSDDRIADLQLIATELATNSLQHSRSACRLAFWEYDGHMICETSDNGRFDDPLAGYRPDAAGRGLLVVNAIADLVRLYTTPNGTTIRTYLQVNPK